MFVIETKIVSVLQLNVRNIVFTFQRCITDMETIKIDPPTKQEGNVPNNQDIKATLLCKRIKNH